MRSGRPVTDIWKVGIINVMTLTGKSEELVDFMEKEKIDVLGLSEVKWKGKGKRKMRKGYTLFWSGGQEAKNGVGIIIKQTIEEYVETVEYTSDRIMKMRLRTSNGVKDFIQVYAPQTGNKEENTEEFLEKLENEITDVEVIVMGDLNAQVGNERLGKEEVIGPFGYGKKNEEGEKLGDFCERNGLIVGNTWFRKKNSHKITRYGWGERRTKTAIDYFLVEKTNRRQLMDVTALPGEAFDGDHRVVVAKLKMGKMERIKAVREKKIKVWKLKDRKVQENFRELLKPKIPNTEVGSVEEEWGKFKEAFVSSAEKSCGRVSGRMKEKETPWWNERVKEAVQEKKKAWQEWNRGKKDESKRKYLESKKKCKKVVAEEKKKSWEEFTRELEEDVNTGKRMLYGITKSKRNDRTYTKIVKGECGELITQPEEIRKRWKEYFDKLLNVKSSSENRKQVQQTNLELEEEEDITMLEVELAVRGMKTGKAAGIDEISVEMIKAAGPIGLQWLYRLLRCIWTRKCVPEEWGKGIIIPIFKKGDRKLCENYRGITLTSQVAKIMERILERRMREKVEGQLEEEQHGFRPGRSTVDLIFSMRQVMEKHWEYGKELVMTFLDITKAYDSVPREKVWEVMRRKGVGNQTIEILQAMYDKSFSCVQTEVGRTEWFRNVTGLRQGSVLSPLLFIMVMDEIVKESKEACGRREMKLMIFADDIVVWGTNSKDVQEQLDTLNEKVEKYGMRFNVDKSKTMVVTRGEREGKGQINIRGQEIELVDSFKYLGSELMQNGRMEVEISKRVQQSNAFYQCVRGLVWDREVPMKCKEVLYKTYFTPILTYASETWTMTRKEESKVQASEMKFLRSMLGKTRRDRVRNVDVRKEIGVEKVNDKIEKSRLKWFGHVKRMSDGRIPKEMMETKFEGKRARGRPRTRWIDLVKTSISSRNLDWNKIVVEEEWWKDRGKWRSTIKVPTRLDAG